MELASAFPGYLELVDGSGQEDTRSEYLADDVMTPLAVTSETESHLGAFSAVGKLVLTIDYTAASESGDIGALLATE